MSDDASDSAERAERETGAILGRYELLTKFATGGMAELFLARERGAGGFERVVVVKRLLPHLAERPESVEGFLREGRLVAQLNHPNVVHTYELGEADGEYYLAMEYLHGSTLRELAHLAGDGGIPLWFAVSAVEQACRGLHATHELRDFEGNRVQVIHRDVSPPNLMCTVDGYVKLLDFGVAKAVEGEEATQSGRAKGKFAYMSPEQMKQEELDRRSDIFALGTVAWELCAEERLFRRDNKPRTMRAILEEETPPPSSENPDIPDELDAVVLGALEKDREDRYSTVEAMRSELADVAEAHGLLRDEDQLAEFVESVAGDRLESRHRTIKETLERTLTEKERARLRHERAQQSASSGVAVDTLTANTPTGSEPPGSGDSSVPKTRVDEPPAQHVPVEETRESSAGEADRSARRWPYVLGAVVSLAVVVAGAFLWIRGGQEGRADPEAAPSEVDVSGPPITYAIPPLASEEVVREELSPLVRYLEGRIKRPFELTVVDSYSAASTGVSTGRFDLAMLPPLTFVRTRRKTPKIQPFAVREMDGSVRNDGLLLARNDSEFRSLEELRGKTFCFTDRNSTTGNFLPRVAMRQRGLDPADFIGRVHWSGNHRQVLRDLLNEKCVAAATYSGSLMTAKSAGIEVGHLRTLAVTGHSTTDTVTARPGLERDLVEQLETSHLEFDPSEVLGDDSTGENLETTGFQKPRPELYDSLRNVVENHSDILEKFKLSLTPDAGIDRGD